MERETLTKIDSMELVGRGSTYIEGIAMVFEGRNYLVIMTALLTSLFGILVNIWVGMIAGVISLLVVEKLKSGKAVSHIAEVQAAKVRVDGPDLFVDNVYIMNVGLKSNQEIIAARGMGFILTPFNSNGKVTLSNLGQRQAILYDLATILGVYRDDGEPALIPMAKLDMKDGRLAVFILPQELDADKGKAVIMRVPILESAVRMPTEASVNKKGAEEMAEILAVVSIHADAVSGGAPIFIAENVDKLEETSFLLEKILDASAHDLKNGTIILVNHR